MPYPVAVDLITLSSREQEQLERIVRRHTSPQRLVRRARIVLLAAQGVANEAISRQVEISPDQVRKWRRRWLESDSLALAEQRLRDLPRPGAPPTFSAEQMCQIMAIACEEPHQSGWPITQWTPLILAQEAKKRGIVETISETTVRDFLKSGRSAAAQSPLLAQCKARRPIPPQSD